MSEPSRYSDHVITLEAPLQLRPQAASAARATLIGGQSAAEAYGNVFNTDEGFARLRGRTPFSLDRDRILYSDAFRRQDDKFHVLFFGRTRRSRNYTSHAVRSAHLSRIIASRLHLNADLAEAIALGAKVGAVPFIHVGRDEVGEWLWSKLDATSRRDGDPSFAKTHKVELPAWAKPAEGTAALQRIPDWLGQLGTSVAGRSSNVVPWAYGDPNASAYSAGSQSFWLLATNPFMSATRSSNPDTAYSAQTLYGVWRHSLVKQGAVLPPFLYASELGDKSRMMLSERDATYEAAIVRYADDIAWVIENLNEASRVEALDNPGHGTSFSRFGGEVTREDSDIALPQSVIGAFWRSDAGRVFSYFVEDLVRTTESNLGEAPEHPSETDLASTVALSPDAQGLLNKMKEFLDEDVFKKPGVIFRNNSVKAITNTALEILYSSWEQALIPQILGAGRIEGWAEDYERRAAEQRLNDPVFRAQACVSVLANMGDRDVFDLVGLD